MRTLGSMSVPLKETKTQRVIEKKQKIIKLKICNVVSQNKKERTSLENFKREESERNKKDVKRRKSSSDFSNKSERDEDEEITNRKNNTKIDTDGGFLSSKLDVRTSLKLLEDATEDAYDTEERPSTPEYFTSSIPPLNTKDDIMEEREHLPTMESNLSVDVAPRTLSNWDRGVYTRVPKLELKPSRVTKLFPAETSFPPIKKKRRRISNGSSQKDPIVIDDIEEVIIEPPKMMPKIDKPKKRKEPFLSKKSKLEEKEVAEMKEREVIVLLSSPISAPPCKTRVLSPPSTKSSVSRVEESSLFSDHRNLAGSNPEDLVGETPTENRGISPRMSKCSPKKLNFELESSRQVKRQKLEMVQVEAVPIPFKKVQTVFTKKKVQTFSAQDENKRNTVQQKKIPGKPKFQLSSTKKKAGLAQVNERTMKALSFQDYLKQATQEPFISYHFNNQLPPLFSRFSEEKKKQYLQENDPSKKPHQMVESSQSAQQLVILDDESEEMSKK